MDNVNVLVRQGQKVKVVVGGRCVECARNVEECGDVRPASVAVCKIACAELYFICGCIKAELKVGRAENAAAVKQVVHQIRERAATLL